MIAPQPGGMVDGELFELTPEEYAATLAGCDELEEIPPGQLVGREHQRQRVSVETVEGITTAWVYVQPRVAEEKSDLTFGFPVVLLISERFRLTLSKVDSDIHYWSRACRSPSLPLSC